MNNVRFKIGIPRAGSAARISEEEGWKPTSLRPSAGSAARDAEERKRAEGVRPKLAATIALRASGGAVTGASGAAPVIPDVSSVKSSEISSQTSGGDRISSTYFVSPDAVTQPPAPSVPELGTSTAGSADEFIRPGVLQGAAARIQSLTRSFFQRGT